MRFLVRATVVAAAILAAVLPGCAPSGVTTRGDADRPDPVMGDWEGHRVADDGTVVPMTVQVIPLGEKKYRFNIHTSSDARNTPVAVTYEGTLDGSRLVVPDFPGLSATFDRGVVSGRTTLPQAKDFRLKPVLRLSPNLGAAPPQGAVVLFDGTGLGGWERRDQKQRGMPVGWKTADGVLEVAPGSGDIMTRQKFTDFRLHIEFRSPFMPGARGQARGNSGVYLQGRYEVQVLDSYGLRGEDNECGGIYRVGAPRVNMCSPPGQWQTYDIMFIAPRFGPDGTKLSDARVTVDHNGTLIHENRVVPGPTGGAVDEAAHLPGPILLQDHGDLVQYRNIWVYEMKR